MSNKTSAINKILILDCETSGMFFGTSNPAVSGNKRYEAISWGFIVADGTTLDMLDHLYVEITPSNQCMWSDKAEAVHGLSRAYLAENGKHRDDAICDIAEFIFKHFDPSDSIVLAGQNAGSFDKYFLLEIFDAYGLQLKLSHRTVDTFSVGYTTFGFTDSDQLFNAFQCRIPGQPHNALTDAAAVLKVLQTVRRLIKSIK